MFNNIGGKIKKLAGVMTWIGFVGAFIGGIALMDSVGDDLEIIVPVLVWVVGGLLSWVGSFLLYGFGQLIENTDILVQQGYARNRNHDDLLIHK